jgi:uncharacterized membrane protein YidH (DUF202 family)
MCMTTKTDMVRDWITTILGALIILVDVLLFTAHVWHRMDGKTQGMGILEWTAASVVLAAGMALLGVNFNPLHYIPGKKPLK